MLDRRSFFAGAVGAAGGLALAAPVRAASARGARVRQNRALMANRSRNIVGKMPYISDDGAERGRKGFSFTYRKDNGLSA